jgi:protein involved in polysaccharide export with SLBB domain
MKKIVLFALAAILSGAALAQSDALKQYMRFAPSNLNATNVNPADIPSEQVLRQMGLSEEEIQEAMDFKYQRGKYHPNAVDSSAFAAKNDRAFDLYTAMGDTAFFNDSIQYPIGKIFGQDVFRNNELNFFNRAFDAQAPDNYLLGEGDELTISIWGMADHSETVFVNDKGYVATSQAGRIYVGGKNFKTAKSLIKNRMGNFYDLNRSQLDVTLNYSRVITVNIVGEVFNPGSYTIPATNTAFNALMAAGGPSQIGSVRNIYLRRDGETIDSLDVYAFLFDPASSQDLFMQNNDYLYVAPAARIVEIKGAVNRPYTYEAKAGDVVADMIRYAGGFTAKAYRNGIEVHRIDENNIKTLTVDATASRNLKMQVGDEIVVNSILGIPSNVVKVHSSTGVSGDYEFVEGETVYDMMLKSNSLTEETYVEKAYLVRTKSDFSKEYIVLEISAIIADATSSSNIVLKEYDELYILSQRDFMDEFEVEVNGGVRSAGAFHYGEGVTLGDALLLAGGMVQESAGGKIEISRVVDYNPASNQLSPKRAIVQSYPISKEGQLSESALAFELKPYDQLSVRINPDFEEVRTVKLLGEVNYPGTYTLLSRDETVADLIKRAGGMKSHADSQSAQMYRWMTVEKEANNMIDHYEDDAEIVNGFFSDGEFVQIVPTNEEESQMKMGEKEYIDLYNPVYLHLGKALKRPKSAYNLVLQDRDSIVVPVVNDVVTITGALEHLNENAINAPYFEGMRANYYINNFAGGFTKHNVKENTYVVYASGKVKKATDLGLFVLYPKVEPGATVKVTEDVKIKRQKPQPVDWTRILEGTVTKVSAIASLYILYLSRQ